MPKLLPPFLLLFLVLTLLPGASTAAEDLPPLPTAHENRSLYGWTIRVDRRLLAGPDAALGTQAYTLLSHRLQEITMVVRPEPLRHLQTVPIQLDLTHGALKSMQYHPNPAWLREHGYSESLAKCVHIPSAQRLVSPFENHRQPWAVLHELAHAYHDQVFGFEEPRIRQAYEKFRDSGRYESVLTVNGGHRRHYALTNQMEFFAEMSEAYFGRNDFYPFVAGELKEAEPEIFQLLVDIWGPLPAP